MKKILLPVVIVVVGFAIAAALIATGPTLAPRPPENLAPLVRVMTAEPRQVQLNSVTHGTVVPRTESELIPEVSGRVIEISPQLVSGGFFREGDVLMRIDTLDYDLALEQAKAGLARAQSELQNARKAYARQKDLARQQSTSESQQDDAMNRLLVGQASLREAQARLSKAERDLQRTALVAPFDGRVRTERVDKGQFVSRGVSVATLYATDYAEVRLPLHDDELAFLQLPLAGEPIGDPPLVLLKAEFAGGTHTWQGEVVRTEGELDAQTRMINVVARVASPYEQSGNRPPLAVGLFVRAEIQGDLVSNITVVPRVALRPNNQVYVVSNGQLEFRDVTVLRVVNDEVYLSAGVNRGEKICISPLETALPGMNVRGVEAVPAQPAGAEQ